MGTSKRPGRPWAAARGSCKEINDLVHILRDWLDASNVSVTRLHRLLTPEHFGGDVPAMWRLREQLNGVRLTWELAEAVADVCFPYESGEHAADRLEVIRPLWEAAGTAPTATATHAAYDLVEAQKGTIAALEDLNRVRQAFEVSEQARVQALQVATVLFALLGQAQAQVAQLTRRLDAMRASADPEPVEVRTTSGRLERARKQTEDLRLQLARAEAERDKAQQVADLAARQIIDLEEELRELRREAKDEGPLSGGTEVVLPAPADAADDDALDQVDAALRKARDVLDREHEAVQEAAEDIGWWDDTERRIGGRVIPGQASERVVPGEAVDEDVPGAGERLSGTTPDNPQTSEDAAVGDLPPAAFPLGDVLEGALDQIEAIGSSGRTGLLTGFKDLDMLTGGLHPGQLIVLAGATAMGKSALAQDILRSVSIGQGLPSVLFTLEQSRNEVVMRLLSAECRVALNRMRSGTMDDEDWTRLARRMPDVSAAPLYIQDGANSSLTELCAHARRLHARNGIRLIVIDAVHLLTYDLRPMDSRFEENSEIALRLKLLATELDVPVIAVSQLNPTHETPTPTMPTLADLRESGTYENNADLVVLLHREDAYVRDTPRAGEADLIIAKHRQGPTGVVTVAFQGHYSRFVDFS
ncbi:DnaB-like helicase C-terminal domain-containing protein [Streptomyces sp. NPDC057430]|uniref:DnaB-like helicase C-terminal domain-containing protein n=1 Tax=unclassified Streptomyces TaxID=2593676 RepID=UPI003691B97C